MCRQCAKDQSRGDMKRDDKGRFFCRCFIHFIENTKDTKGTNSGYIQRIVLTTKNLYPLETLVIASQKLTLF